MKNLFYILIASLIPFCAFGQTLDPLSAMRIHLPTASSNFDRINSGLPPVQNNLPPTYLPGKIYNTSPNKIIDYQKFIKNDSIQQQNNTINVQPVKTPIMVKNSGIYELNINEIKKNR